MVINEIILKNFALYIEMCHNSDTFINMLYFNLVLPKPLSPRSVGFNSSTTSNGR